MNPRIDVSRRNFVIGAAASAGTATPRISGAAAPTIRVQPDNDLQDIPLSIRLSGFSPRQPVMVTAGWSRGTISVGDRRDVAAFGIANVSKATA
jgi:hypothetical protein